MSSISHYIDDFIANLPEFAKAICLKLDELIHQAEPAIAEGKKWGSISYWTESGLVCGFYATKEFVTFVFYDGALMKNAQNLFDYNYTSTKNRRSIKFTSIDEVNSHATDIVPYIREAVENSKKGLKTKTTVRTIEIPEDFQKALERAELLEDFAGMAYSMRKEYIVWIEGAKKEETRQRRIEKALGQIAKGITMNEKYRDTGAS